MTPTEFALAARQYCLSSGGSVTSWGRTTSHNAAVGGQPGSRHISWTAVDVVYDNPMPFSDAETLAAHFGLHVIRESSHDHISPLDDPH
jgi:Peptidase M15